MKFVQNNKILEDSNAENAEISAEKTKSKPRHRNPHTACALVSPLSRRALNCVLCA